MIAEINGVIKHFDSDEKLAIVWVPSLSGAYGDHGVSYEVVAPHDAFAELSDRKLVCWKIYHNVTQDSQCLYAFSTWAERTLAKRLTKVQGIGMKVAHRIVTTHGYDGVISAVAGGDAKALSDGVAGFGPKSASRLIDHWKKDFQAICQGSGDPRVPRVRAALNAMNIRYTDESIINLCKSDLDATDSDLVKIFANTK